MLTMNTLSLSARADTWVKKYVHHHFSGAWTGRVFLSTGHPDLQISLRFKLSQLFTYNNTLRSSARARTGNSYLRYRCCNVRKLREFLQASRSVRRRHNLLLLDGVNARKHTYTDCVLGTFAKLRKAIIISIMPVRPSIPPSGQPSVCPRGRIRLPLDEFSRKSIFEDFLKICQENSGLTKIWQEWRVLYVNIYIYLWYLAEFLSEQEMFRP